MRQINVTSIARSLHCTKPQLDQMRRGKGDTTIQTLKGTVVHAMFDRLLEGERDLDAICDQVLPSYSIQIASIVDDFFDEAAFRAEVLRHLESLSRRQRTFRAAQDTLRLRAALQRSASLYP